MAGGKALAAMAVAMPVRSMRPTPETAIGRVAVAYGSAVRATWRAAFSAAVASRPKTHRYGTDGCGTYQRQNDSARALHGVAPVISLNDVR